MTDGNDLGSAVKEIEAALSDLRKSLQGTSSLSSRDSESAKTSLKEALKLIVESKDVVACW